MGAIPFNQTIDLTWPNSGPLEEKHWKIWRKFIARALPHDKANRLNELLGRWKVKDEKAKAIRNSKKQTTYIKSGNIWKAYEHNIPDKEVVNKECKGN